jgi:SAM-dependent methyltransferase
MIARFSAEQVRTYLPASIEPADLAYAIESFVHGPDPARFFAQCRQLIRPGGLLVIGDDFRRPTADRAARRAIEQFKRGWHIHTLLDRDELQALAREAGFEHDSTVDLSSYLELNRPRDRAIKVLVGLAGWVPVHWSRLDHLVGGRALQECLERGWIGYDVAVFRRLMQEKGPGVFFQNS